MNGFETRNRYSEMRFFTPILAEVKDISFRPSHCCTPLPSPSLHEESLLRYEFVKKWKS